MLALQDTQQRMCCLQYNLSTLYIVMFAITESLQVAALGTIRDVAMVKMNGLEASKVVLTDTW